ncbi:histone-binding protein N1/N2 [Athalia rosae]|uniref:histone-binding protein N1/N2 n=1 Tax=Athalia rosae TaxID=37344 RepID=UPI00203383E3|nr:histone-binding protein N1/N2 [Athalia rosae]
MADVADNVIFTDPIAAISQGKRHLLVRDYGMAVTALAQACELLAQKHGDTADELGEPYLLYGRALLALAREETGVLGGAVPGSDEIEAEEEHDEDEDNANDEKETDYEADDDEPVAKKSNGAATDAEKEALANNEASAKADSSTKPEGSDSKIPKADSSSGIADQHDKTSEDDKKTADSPALKNSAEEKVESTSSDDKATKNEAVREGVSKKGDAANEVEAADAKPEGAESKEKIGASELAFASTSGHAAEKVTQNGDGSANEEDDVEDDPKEEDEEDINNLQLAWEVLESAKLILLKRGPPGWKHLAEAHRLLGEVGMESGNQQGALTDLQACLDLLAKVEPCDPRAIAETYYQLGLAYSLANEFDASIEQFKEATSLLQAHIQQLNESKDSRKNDDPFYTVEGEIQELKELLPEIEEKIADITDFKAAACKAMVEGIKNKVAAGYIPNGAGPSSDGASSSTAETSSVNQKSATDISHLVRKKRKIDEPDNSTESPSKKSTPEKPV